MKKYILQNVTKKISFKFSFAIIATIITILLLFMYTEINTEIRNGNNKLNAKSKTLTNITGKALSQALWNLSKKDYELIAESLLIDDEIAGIKIFDEHGIIVYSKAKSGIEYYKNQIFSQNVSISNNSTYLGYTTITYTKYFLNKEIANSRTKRLAQISIIVIFLILVTSFISLKITKPIKQLSIGAERVASGDLTKTIVVNTNDEIGELSNKFNYMIKELYAARQAIEKDSIELENKNKEILRYSEKLELLVEERTADYNKANNDLIGKNCELENTIKILNETQNQLIENEKMASLGSLVAGVAHEINTPLGVAITTISYLEKVNNELRKKLIDGCMSKNDLQKFMEDLNISMTILKTNLDRAAELVKNYKQVAVDQSNNIKTVFNLKENIDAIVISLKHEYKKNHHMLHNECPDSININSYAGDFSQIFTNLIMNSLKHGFKDKKNGNIYINAYQERNIITIIYSDDGLGIEEKNMSKIYDPFFTTNRHGGNSGLGLNIIYNIVAQKLKGKINCESNPGEGVKFIIKLQVES